MLSVYGKPDAGHLLNHMHDVGCIGKMLLRILNSIMYLVPNVPADGEFLKIITKALKHLLRIITKKSGVTSLQIQDLSENVIEDIVVGLQKHSLSISCMSIKIHMLVLLQSHILIFSQFRCSAVGLTQTKKARESDEVHLIVLAFRGPMNNVNSTGRVSLMMIGSIKLTNKLIVPMLPEFQQVE